MTPSLPNLPSIRRNDLRKALNWSYLASAVWAAGNVFAGGVLFGYLALELGAKGRELAWLAAAQALVGVLRLFTPGLIVRFGGAKRLCLTTSLASYAMLAGIPIAALADVASEQRTLLQRLVVVYCLHQLLEQIATVALFSWLGDLVPRRVLGRYFGRRSLIQLSVTIAALAANAVAAEQLQEQYADKVLTFALLAGLGVVCYFLAMIPLAKMPATAPRNIGGASTWSEMVAPLKQRSSRRLLAYNCWFSFFQSLLSAPQSFYINKTLNVPYSKLQWMQTTMRVGQALLSPLVGAVSDRRGNMPILIASQVLVGAAPLVFLWTDAAHPNRLYGVYLLWIFYAGINICLPNLTIQLAPAGGQAPHLAAYYVTGSLFAAAGALAGGYTFDWLVESNVAITLGTTHLNPFAILFLTAFVTRTAGALLLLRVQENRATS